jgi:hypothetical protein
MKIELKIPDYQSEQGLIFEWEPGFIIMASEDSKNKTITIMANRSGFISLARHLLELAQEQVPNGEHFHLDEYNSLEKGSCELIFERINEL